MKTAKLIAAGCLLLFAFLVSQAYGWDLQLNSVDDPALLSFQRSLAGVPDPGPGISASSTGPVERGLPASDVLRGNGTRAGYVLSHGGIIPNSETVSLDGGMRARNRDYYLDAGGGMLIFAEPVRIMQVVRVSYRYIPEKDAQRSAMGAPTLALNFGKRGSLGLTYAYNASPAPGGVDLMTYGVNLNSAFGVGSTMNNMLYISSPRESGRISLNLQQQANDSQAKPKSGSVFVHNSDLHLGRLGLKLNYQEVDQDFGGLSVLKQQKVAGDPTLGQLEKEKGVVRLGFQAGYDLGKGASTGLSWSRIGDTGSDIVRQSMDFASERFKLSANVRRIDQDFTRFKDLAEGERDQWAKERGIRRSNIQLSLAPMKGFAADSPWNALSLSSISDPAGKITSRSLNFAAKGFSVAGVDSKVDLGFTRLADLTDAERADMALRIRQHFDPTATAASLTDADRKHIAGETGVHRQNIRSSFQTGKTSAALQLLTIGDETGDIKRQSLSVEGANFKVAGMVQEIGEDFARLTTLAAVEQQQFARESGIRRMNLAGDFKLGSSLQLGASLARAKTEDSGIVKYGLSLKGQKFNMAASFQDIEPEFDRIMDLADANKQQMAAEQGMKRYDLSLGVQASKSVKIDSFFYSAKHSTEDLFKRQLRNSISINPSHGPKLLLFRDEIDSGSSQAASKFLHQTFALDHKIGLLSFKAVQDDIRTEAPAGLKSVQTRTFHFDTDASKRTFLTGDWKKMAQNDDKFEDSQALKLTSRLAANLAFVGARSVVKTDQAETASQEYGLAGKVMGSLSLAAKFGETLVNGLTIGKVRELSLTPGGPKDLGAFKQINWNVRYAEVQKAGKVETQAKAAKVETSVLKHKLAVEYLGSVTKDGQTPIVRSFSIAGDQDPKKRLRYDLAYKVRDPGGASPSLIIRRYNAELQVNPSTKLAYSYLGFNEKPDGNLEPVGLERLKLTMAATKRLGFTSQWEKTRNYQQGTAKTVLSLGLAGKASSNETLEASYGFDRVTSPSGKTSARTYKLTYDRQVSADHFLTFSGRYTDWSGPHPSDPNSDDLLLQIDFRRVFN